MLEFQVVGDFGIIFFLPYRKYFNFRVGVLDFKNMSYFSLSKVGRIWPLLGQSYVTQIFESKSEMCWVTGTLMWSSLTRLTWSKANI